MSNHASKATILHFRTKLVLIGIFLFAIGSVFTAGGASAANPSADLDQCANDPIPSPNTDGCNTNANEWVNGNLGGSKAVYFEGDSIPYRMKFDNLSLASHTVTIRVGHDEERKARARLPHDLQPHGRQRQPLSWGLTVWLAYNVRDSRRPAGYWRRSDAHRRQLHALRRHDHGRQRLLGRSRLPCRRPVPADRDHLHTDSGKSCARLGRAHRHAGRLG